jgi:glycosyltransferase involved in cell wall biosynthesis
MTERLRVLMLSRSYPSDVLPTLGLWVERPSVLLKGRCDVRVVSPVPWFPALPNAGPLRQYVRFRAIPRRELRNGVEVFHPRFPAGPGRSLHSYEARAMYAGLRSTVDRIRERFPFDLIHAHMIHPEGAVAHRLSKRYGVPFVVTEHAPWTEQWFARPTVRREALAAARAASSLLAVSSSVRETMASFGVAGERVRVVPIGVDGETFRLGRPEDRRRDQVLYVGWLNYTKGIDVLLRAMTLLNGRPDPARLVLVGEAIYRNTRLQEEELRRLAGTLDLGTRVTFVGRKLHQEVARLMAESAVVVLPSRAESFGATLVEALASGTPVVATACGGPEDIVTDEVGRLVPAENPEALAAAIEAVLGERRRYAAEELRRYALERFSWDRVVERVYAAYRTAVPRGTM